MSTKSDFQKGAVKPFFTISTNIFDKSSRWKFVLFHERSLDLQNWQKPLLESSLVPPKVNQTGKFLVRMLLCF